MVKISSTLKPFFERKFMDDYTEVNEAVISQGSAETIPKQKGKGERRKRK